MIRGRRTQAIAGPAGLEPTATALVITFGPCLMHSGLSETHRGKRPEIG
ncbi:MAG TPA: hypothetical protein VGS06_27830 [Streptosporangiaceae bacterium]|nr:hypothetical protein [Streptosporangiaceae bacterium]